MKKFVGSFALKLIHDQSGQILPWAMFMAVGLFALGGLSVDLGRAYVADAQLQSYANSAALAAAGEVYNASTTNGATTYANNYSGSSGGYNVNPSLGTVTTTITQMCVNMLMPSGTSCPSSGAVANAIKVTQTATVPMTFMKLLGKSSMTVSASAMASMQGTVKPYNVAIIVDATASMSDAPASGSCTGFSTQFACALNGVATLLGNINPCAGVLNCSQSNAKFRVAIFSFPNVSSATVSDYWSNCNEPTHEPYTFPNTNLTSSTGYGVLEYSGTGSSPTVPTTYEMTPTAGQFPSADGDANGFVMDWWSGSASNHLASSSSIVSEVGGCMKNPGGENTYYAGVIYAAQAALLAEQAADAKNNITSQNAMILLSDGQAQAASSKLASGSPATSSGTPATLAADGLAILTSPSGSKYYPSATNECQQAIAAAQAAQAAGTTVYSVAFGSEDTGCTSSSGGTDSSNVTGLDYTGTTTQVTYSTLTPCLVMKNIASPPSNGNSYFYADTSSASSGCTDTAHTVTNIADIFDAISASFTTPRLIPVSATGVVVSTTN